MNQKMRRTIQRLRAKGMSDEQIKNWVAEQFTKEDK